MGNLYAIPSGTEIILSKENVSLKEKIEDLRKEIKSLTAECERLTDENIKYRSRLDTILKTCVGVLCND